MIPRAEVNDRRDNPLTCSACYRCFADCIDIADGKQQIRSASNQGRPYNPIHIVCYHKGAVNSRFCRLPRNVHSVYFEWKYRILCFECFFPVFLIFRNKTHCSIPVSCIWIFPGVSICSVYPDYRQRNWYISKRSKIYI